LDQARYEHEDLAKIPMPSFKVPLECLIKICRPSPLEALPSVYKPRSG
jgi:hypothetical protein